MLVYEAKYGYFEFALFNLSVFSFFLAFAYLSVMFRPFKRGIKLFVAQIKVKQQKMKNYLKNCCLLLLLKKYTIKHKNFVKCVAQMIKKDIQNFVNNFHENATKGNKIC